MYADSVFVTDKKDKGHMFMYLTFKQINKYIWDNWESDWERVHQLFKAKLWKYLYILLQICYSILISRPGKFCICL